MSAWLCTQRHIAALATAAHDLGHGFRESGETLLRENERSLRSRYEPWTDSYFGDSGLTAPFNYLEPVRLNCPAELLKQLDCYEHQACESSDWEKTAAKKLCAKIAERIRLATFAASLDVLRSCPEYERAQWGLDE
jgi:hypothetical protein